MNHIHSQLSESSTELTEKLTDRFLTFSVIGLVSAGISQCRLCQNGINCPDLSADWLIGLPLIQRRTHVNKGGRLQLWRLLFCFVLG